jgi:hypothetical protein
MAFRETLKEIVNENRWLGQSLEIIPDHRVGSTRLARLATLDIHSLREIPRYSHMDPELSIDLSVVSHLSKLIKESIARKVEEESGCAPRHSIAQIKFIFDLVNIQLDF